MLLKKIFVIVFNYKIMIRRIKICLRYLNSQLRFYMVGSHSSKITSAIKLLIVRIHVVYLKVIDHFASLMLQPPSCRITFLDLYIFAQEKLLS